jgi:hypothetical protein
VSYYPSGVNQRKKSSSSTAFHEGVTINLESFLIASNSGSSYYLSNRRLDFEGVLTRVKIKIQGVTDSKGTLEWKDGKYKVIMEKASFQHPNNITCRGIAPAPEYMVRNTGHHQR